MKPKQPTLNNPGPASAKRNPSFHAPGHPSVPNTAATPPSIKTPATSQDFSKKFFVFFIVWALSCSIGIYFRLYPLLTNASHESEEKAMLLVISNLRKTVALSVERQNPHLAKTQKNVLMKDHFDRLLRADRDKIRVLAQKLARQMDENSISPPKPPYLLESDSFLYYGLTENIMRTGHMSDTVKGSKYLNKLMLAPLGHWEPLNLHPYVGYFIYKIMSWFDPHVWSMYAVSFTPLVVMCLAVAAFLTVCRILECSPLISFLGSVNLVLASIFLKRSMFGWYDNDPYNIFFPFCILAVLFYGLKYAHSIKKLVVVGGISSLLIAGYALFWQGWVFLESILVISGILILIYNHFFLKRKSYSKSLLIYFTVVTLGSFVGIGMIFGFKEFFTLFQEGWTALQNFLKPQLSFWPDLYIGVGELRKSSLPYIIDLTGGYVSFAIAIIGLIVYSIRLLFSARKESQLPLIVILTFAVFAVMMTLGAERFAILCLIPLSLFFTLGLQWLFNFLEKKFPLQIPLSETSQNFSLHLLILPVIFTALPIFTAQQETPALLNQIYNDVWDQALTKIKTETPADSIINTWWPPGHFIKTVAERRVTFDGATINQPQGYWLANVFLTDDENQSLGLLRMLNNSANQGAEYLISQGLKISETVDLLTSITPLSSSAAKEKLESRLSDEQIEHLLTLTHKDPPPSYLFLYNDLVEKNLQLSFVGHWNFQKIEKINSHSTLRQSVLHLDFPSYIQFLWRMVGGPPKYSDILGPIAQNGSQVIFQNNVQINLEKKECLIDSPKFGHGSPQGLIYEDGDQLVEKKFFRTKLPYSVILFKRLGAYNCILLDTDLAKSMLIRLYFLEGKGLKYFIPFSHDVDTTGTTEIYVYRIDWDNFIKDLDRPNARL